MCIRELSVVCCFGWYYELYLHTSGIIYWTDRFLEDQWTHTVKYRHRKLLIHHTPDDIKKS